MQPGIHLQSPEGKRAKNGGRNQGGCDIQVGKINPVGGIGEYEYSGTSLYTRSVARGNLTLYRSELYNQGMITIHKCLRCGHEWPSRLERLPKVCPKCNSPYWNKPKWKGVKK